MPANRTQIQAFLEKNPLMVENEPASISKAGLVPFIKATPMLYYVMTPVAKHPELGMPEFQLCKGTRMWKKGDEWIDMRGHVPDDVTLEVLAVTALREGVEELGVVLKNIQTLHPLGIHGFSSATTHRVKEMWLLAAEMKQKDNFLPAEMIAEATAECAWMSLTEFRKKGRPDHAHVLEQVEKQLCA